MLAIARRYKGSTTLKAVLLTADISCHETLTRHIGTETKPAASGPEKVIKTPNKFTLNHDKLQKLTLVERSYIPAAARAPGGNANVTDAIFNPSPASQMCQTMAFGYSLFFKDSYIRPDLLKKAVASLATELPPLAGRVRPPKNAAGLRSMNETVVNLNNSGIELTIAETKCHKIEDLGPHTWLAGMNNRKLSSFGVPFYTEPFSVENMYKGEEALFKLKLTRCIDGQILSVNVCHLLADAGRAVRLMERLSELYRANCAGIDPGPGLHFNPELETPQGLAAALKNPPSTWNPPIEDHHLTLAQWMAAPYRMYRHTARKFDVHMVYLPKIAVQRLKYIAVEEQKAQTGDNFEREQKVSTMDAVQAFIATLVADLKQRALVPTFPEEMTVNVDLLHKDVPYKNPEALERHIGNAVHILHVHGVEPGTYVPNYIINADTESTAKSKLSTALGMNARLIRRSVSTFRSDVTNALQALERQALMTSLPEIKVGAAFVVKGADMKVASTTAVTAFSFDKINFGWGPAHFAQINYQPRFDWWTIIQGAQGYGECEGGVVCSMTVEAGLSEKLSKHAAWRVLVPEAHVFVAEEEREDTLLEDLHDISVTSYQTLFSKKGEHGRQPATWREENVESHIALGKQNLACCRFYRKTAESAP